MIIPMLVARNPLSLDSWGPPWLTILNHWPGCFFSPVNHFELRNLTVQHCDNAESMIWSPDGCLLWTSLNHYSCLLSAIVASWSLLVRKIHHSPLRLGVWARIGASLRKCPEPWLFPSWIGPMMVYVGPCLRPPAMGSIAERYEMNIQALTGSGDSCIRSKIWYESCSY